MPVRVLLAIRQPALRRRIERLLRQPGISLVGAASQATLRDRLRRQDIDLVVATRAGVPHDLPRLVRELRDLPERPELVIVEEQEAPERQAELLSAGCMAVLLARVADDLLAESLLALARRSAEEVAERLARERSGTRYSLSDFVTASAVMRRFLALARRVAPTDVSLLILGETGVGKERLARAIHTEGPRAAGPFIAINCGALPENLLESELFGHEEGAFTGAHRARRGYFELAHRGTIFLDEVGEIPLHLQVKLLRVLEDRRIQRVGGERTVDIDVRVIAATNRDLEAEVQAKSFRADLYFRLAVVTLTLPPLRERREDIPDLVQSYLEYFKGRFGCQASAVSFAALEALARYSWPGNVRELINVVEQVLLLSSADEVQVADLPRRVLAASDPAPPLAPAGPFSASPAADKPLQLARQQTIEAFEREYLAGILGRTQGRVGLAAARAGISARHLHELMKRHGIRKEAYKVPDP